jgi:hypothetical protein
MRSFPLTSADTPNARSGARTERRAGTSDSDLGARTEPAFCA